VTFESGTNISILGKSAFQGCSSLQSICIPSSIQIIGDFCFSECEAMSDLTFESGCQVSILGDSACSACSRLQAVCIPSSIETICSSCFEGCSHLSIVLEPGCKLSDELVCELRERALEPWEDY
jgi:hypothetical protein